MKLQKTTSYKKFKKLEGNRELNPMQINVLKRSIEKMPQLLPALPIVVNEEFEILDGQHRFEACKALKCPVYYIVAKGLGLDEVRQMNSTSQRWTLVNYAESFASMGVEDYQFFLELHEKFPEIKVSSIPVLMTGAVNTHGFRSGKLRLKFTRKEVLNTISKLYDLRDIYPYLFEKPFINAFIKVSSHSDYDHNRMLQQVSNARHILLEARSRVYKDCLRILEEVYNYNFKTNIVRLF